jgi:hypothetical protein
MMEQNHPEIVPSVLVIADTSIYLKNIRRQGRGENGAAVAG